MCTRPALRAPPLRLPALRALPPLMLMMRPQPAVFSCWWRGGCCGICGLKPTHGLVPYTGFMPIELTLDHTGPMTATVEDNALLLEVLAGPDALDPRQYGAAPKPYREALGRSAAGLRIAMVE